MTRSLFPVFTVAALLAIASTAGATEHPTLDEAQHLFYNGRYADAAELAQRLQFIDIQNLGAYELRTSALHFQLRDALGDRPDKDKEKALKQCASCPELLKAFLSDTTRGQEIARSGMSGNTKVPKLHFEVRKNSKPVNPTSFLE